MKNENGFKKWLPLWVLLSCLLFLTGCKDAATKGNYVHKYSKDEIRLMMRYHGALVARYDGKQWWCLQGKRWIKIDSARAAGYARLQLKKTSRRL
ncbi:MAG: hypothetical protein DSZ23_06055 [Thermodesulfatator sp.]|nr:MAG: hypothetical protein DSZ23_06055 [Thermodesulfatator sp.]